MTQPTPIFFINVFAWFHSWSGATLAALTFIHSVQFGLKENINFRWRSTSRRNSNFTSSTLDAVRSQLLCESFGHIHVILSRQLSWEYYCNGFSFSSRQHFCELLLLPMAPNNKVIGYVLAALSRHVAQPQSSFSKIITCFHELFKKIVLSKLWWL